VTDISKISLNQLYLVLHIPQRASGRVDIKNDDIFFSFFQKIPNHFGPNKTGTTCNKYTYFSVDLSIKGQISLKTKYGK